jgi:hypothetical protein
MRLAGDRAASINPRISFTSHHHPPQHPENRQCSADGFQLAALKAVPVIPYD